MEVKRVNELLKKLKSIDDVVQGEIVRDAVARGCKTVQSSAKRLCPVDKGELRSSIMTKIEAKDGRITGKVYTNKEYAAYVEFGTGQRGEAEHDGTSPDVTVGYSSEWRGQPAQPYMYPALKNNEEAVTKQISKDITNEIRKLVK